jgi:hypothetical protein
VIAALLRPTVARLCRTSRTRLVVGAWCAVGIAFAVGARARALGHGADQVLVGGYGELVLPLLCYSLVGAALQTRSLSKSIAPLVALGAVPARAAAVGVAISFCACALVGSLLAAASTLIAHGSADPPLSHDVLASAYAGALGGAAYGSWFVFGASFGAAGLGRTLFLALDWLLDALGGAAALVTPRSHVRNLLGGLPPMEWPERWSAFALLGLTIGYALISVYRVRR